MKNNMFEYRGYYGSVEYSLEDECFFGEIMGISDLVLYEGDNIQ
jgi:predicted HicB family RNase H-like nuclease